MAVSLPTRGAWIEIAPVTVSTVSPDSSLPTRGAWIEIHFGILGKIPDQRRSPHGERGLK